MKFIEYTEKLDTIKYMAEHYRTGSREELAIRLNVSVRTVGRMIQQLRDHGYPIAYNHFRNSYVVGEPAEKILHWKPAH